MYKIRKTKRLVVDVQSFLRILILSGTSLYDCTFSTALRNGNGLAATEHLFSALGLLQVSSIVRDEAANSCIGVSS